MLPWITIFGSLVMRFANDFHSWLRHSWLRHSWKSLANRITRDPKIVIHGNSCIILYICNQTKDFIDGIRLLISKLHKKHLSEKRLLAALTNSNAAGRTSGLWRITAIGWIIIWTMVIGALIQVGTVINSLGPSDAIWRHGTRSTLAQVMACCLTAPSHYLNQCWLIISKVLWQAPVGYFKRDTPIHKLITLVWKLLIENLKKISQGSMS